MAAPVLATPQKTTSVPTRPSPYRADPFLERGADERSGSRYPRLGAKAERPNLRHRALIGLYGDALVPSTSGGQFGGAGNLTQITAVTEGSCFDPDVNRDGNLLVFASTQHEETADLYIKSTRGKTITRITADPAPDLMPAFAPDGKRIAFASLRSGNWNIFITDTNGAPSLQLTFDQADELHPTWSPDGTMIAYCKRSIQSLRWEIWVVEVANPATPRFLEYGLFPNWNPDPAESKIAFQRARGRNSRLFAVWTIDLKNGEALHPTEIVSAANAAAMHPSWSPDGSRIVFTTVLYPDEQAGPWPRRSELWVINVNGSGRTSLVQGEHMNLYPVWSNDGAVYFLSDRSGTDNIWAVETGRTISLSRAPDS